MAKPFKETKLGAWLKKHAPDLLDKADDFFPPLSLITAAVKSKGLGEDVMKEFDEVSAEYEQNERRDWLADVANARSREVETVKSGRKLDLLMVVTGFIILSLAVLTVVAVFFLDLKNKELAHFIAGEIIGMSLGTMVSYYFGSSKGSVDKTEVIKSMK